jgi:hypothetical protein
VGNGLRNRFWEDRWFGSCSLAIQFWELYILVNEQEASDGEILIFNFRRTVDSRLFDQWMELCQIASSLQFSEEDDSIIWQFSSSSKYSVQSLYSVINNRG